MLSIVFLGVSLAVAAPQEPAPTPKPKHPWSELILRGGVVWTGAEPWREGLDISCRYQLLEWPSVKMSAVCLRTAASPFLMCLLWISLPCVLTFSRRSK